MLSFKQYKDGWESKTPKGFGMRLPIMHGYLDYVKREIYKQDYLDLFASSKPTYPRVIVTGKFKVQLSASLFTEYPPNFLNKDGDDVLVDVDYDHPWLDKLNEGRKIKYIMIGEAAPAPKVDTKKVYSFKIGKYFYDCSHSRDTPWFYEPYKALVGAWGKSPSDKKDALLQLANKGYYLIDVYPYAMEYTSNLRDKLNKSGVTEHFFSGVTVIPELNSLALPTSSVLAEEPIIAFSGPATTHHHIAELIVSGAISIPSAYDTFVYPNTFTTSPSPIIPVSAIVPDYFRISFPVGMYLNGKYLNTSKVECPYYRCCTDIGRGHGPNTFFIINAFDL